MKSSLQHIQLEINMNITCLKCNCLIQKILVAIQTTAFKPLDCDDMERSIQLCNGIEYLIDEFQRQTNGKESSQLFNSEYQAQLLKIASHLEELIHRLTYLTNKNNMAFYFTHLYPHF